MRSRSFVLVHAVQIKAVQSKPVKVNAIRSFEHILKPQFQVPGDGFGHCAQSTD
jgi:hypothetical protein